MLGSIPNPASMTQREAALEFCAMALAALNNTHTPVANEKRRGPIRIA
jgi:hypothetical protein